MLIRYQMGNYPDNILYPSNSSFISRYYYFDSSTLDQVYPLHRNFDRCQVVLSSSKVFFHTFRVFTPAFIRLLEISSMVTFVMIQMM